MKNNPAIVTNALYTSEQLISSLGISKATLQSWIDQGMKSAMPGTRRRYFLGQHVIDFIMNDWKRGIAIASDLTESADRVELIEDGRDFRAIRQMVK